MGLLVSGLGSIDQLMDRAVIGARDSLEKSSSIVIKSIQANFDTRGLNTDSEPWAPVPTHWLEQRQTWPDDPGSQAAYIKDHFPLVDTKRLRNSFTYTDAELPSGDVQGEVYPTVEYAKDHEQGVPGKIRRRSFMQIPEQDASDVAEDVAKSMQVWLTA